MNIVLMQVKISLEELTPLMQEFPHYLFLSLSEEGLREIGEDNWNRVEILLGSSLTSEELKLCPHLKWIHVPDDDLSNLCLDEIALRGNIIVTYTENPNMNQTADFAIGCILAFAKQLFHWKEADKFPELLWEAKWRDSMWDIKNKTLLQVGLNPTGSLIAEKAQSIGMKVIGIHTKKTFHPVCKRTLPIKDLNSVLPAADIVVLTLPKQDQYHHFFQKDELELMKDDSILIVLESNRSVDENALALIAKNKFRGIAIDVYRGTPIPTKSPLYSLPHIMISPNAAQLPPNEEFSAFHTFRRNLRNYFQGNFIDMATIYEEKPLPLKKK